MTNSPEMRALDPARVKAVAYEISSYLGEQPDNVDNGGCARWETWKPLAASILGLSILSAPHAQGDVAGLADNGLTATIVEDMRAKWRSNPAMPFAQRVAFSNICDAALVALSLPLSDGAVAEPVASPSTHDWIADAGPVPRADLEATSNLEAQVERLSTLPSDWDGYGAEPLDRSFVTDFADRIETDGALTQLVPGGDGSIQAEWHLSGEVSVEIHQQTDGEWSIFVASRPLASPINPVPAGVGVRELVWQAELDNRFCSGDYIIVGAGGWTIYRCGMALELAICSTLDEAKAATQADYEARIRSAIILRQAPDAEQVLIGVTFVKADVMVVGRIDDENKPAADGPYVWLMIDPKDGKVINYSVPVASVEALRAPTQDKR